MSEGTTTAIVAGVFTILGAALGFVGTHMATVAARRKDNFQIRKEHLETSMNAWGAVRRASDSLANDYVHEAAKDNKAILLRYVRQITNVCGCMAATPWVFSKKAREMELRLKGDLGLFSLALDLPTIRAHTLPDAITMQGLEDMLSRDAGKVMEIQGKLEEHLADMRSLAEKELEQLNAEYRKLIASGI
jgi:hypothetical protein